jgi:hypothetical protein
MAQANGTKATALMRAARFADALTGRPSFFLALFRPYTDTSILNNILIISNERREREVNLTYQRRLVGPFKVQ